jgi:hypothetical protein
VSKPAGQGTESDREPPESPSPDRNAGVGRVARVAKAVAAAIPVAAASVALVAGAVGVLYLVSPGAKPDEPPATKGADLTVKTLDRVTFRQYLDRVAVSSSGYRRTQLERLGALVQVKLVVRGYRNKRLPLWWRMVDTRTNEQIRQSKDLFYTPYANHDENISSIWVPLPRGRNRRFFIEVELLDDGGKTPLGETRTRRFSGR